VESFLAEEVSNVERVCENRYTFKLRMERVRELRMTRVHESTEEDDVTGESAVENGVRLTG